MIKKTLYTALAVLTAGAALFTAGCKAPEGNAEQGERWYSMHHCNNCHGKQGIGGKAAELAGLRMGFSSFEKYLRDPKSASMPPFPEARLPKQDAADIYLWLKGLEK